MTTETHENFIAGDGHYTCAAPGGDSPPQSRRIVSLERRSGQTFQPRRSLESALARAGLDVDRLVRDYERDAGTTSS
jgi:hypothetical protein